MIKVFMIDSTEKSLYYNAVLKYVDASNIDVEESTDRALNRLSAKPYQLIVLSRGTGKYDLYDVVDLIKQTKIVNKAYIFIVEDNPTVAAKLTGMLRGHKVYSFKSNQLTELEKLVERMAS